MRAYEQRQRSQAPDLLAAGLASGYVDAEVLPD